MDGKELVPGTIKGTAEAVEGVLKAVPIYQDLAHPAVRELGSALKGAVRVALAPVSLLVWGYDQIKEYLEDAIAQRLADLPPEQIITPSPIIAGPAIEALRYAGHDPTLREMYANLLVAAMDAKRVREAHPAFVEIIRQLTPDEARIVGLFKESDYFAVIDLNAQIRTGDTSQRTLIKRFSTLCDTAKCEFPELGSSYIDNLCRLGLMIEDKSKILDPPDDYDRLENHPKIQRHKKRLTARGLKYELPRHLLRVTSFGSQFHAACVG